MFTSRLVWTIKLTGALVRLVAVQPVGGLVPVFRKVAELAVTDDDQEVKIGPVALHREGLVDPPTLGVGAEQDDLQDAAALLEFGRTFLQRIFESDLPLPGPPFQPFGLILKSGRAALRAPNRNGSL